MVDSAALAKEITIAEAPRTLGTTFATCEMVYNDRENY
jgi:hypothetical protein